MRALGDLIRPEPRRRPRPWVEIELAVAVPAWLVRAVGGGVVAGLLTWVVGDWVLPLLVAVVAVTVAHLGTVAAITLLAMLAVLVQQPDLRACAVLVLALHVLLLTTRLTAPLPPTGLVEGRLIARALAGFVVIQLLAQAMVGIAFAAMAGMPVLPWLGVVALGGVVVALVAAVRWTVRHTSR